MANQALHVVWEDPQWAVKKPNTSTAMSKHNTQDQAIEAARTWLRRNGGGELIVHGKDGKISRRDTVPPGNDPYPPRG